MPPRRSHPKSRRGCLTCKQRHVKCPEDGPPCTACKTRRTPCEYASPGPTLQVASSKSILADPDINGDAEAAPPVFPQSSNAGSGAAADKRLLELQLMNRWSTTTYKSLVTPVANDEYVWQTKVPAMALEHDFLLKGVFAITAFEIATSSERERELYVHAGIDYQSWAVASFRNKLQDIHPDSFEAMLSFSLILMVLALASARYSSGMDDSVSTNMVQSTLTHFELLRGCAVVLDNQPTFIEESPYIRRLKRFSELPQVPLDAAADAAMSKLSEANEQRVASSIADPYERRVEQVSYWQACKMAISLLRECWAKCADADHRGYALGWLNMAGEDYVKAIKASDGIALLTLMYWGVLVESLGHEVWWAKDFGSLLVQEISTRMFNDHVQALANELILAARKLTQETSATRATT